MSSRPSFYEPLLLELEAITAEIEWVGWENSKDGDQLEEQDELCRQFVARIRHAFEKYESEARNVEGFQREVLIEASQSMRDRIGKLPVYGLFPQLRLRIDKEDRVTRATNKSHHLTNAFIEGIGKLHYRSLEKAFENAPCRCRLEFMTRVETEPRPATDKKTHLEDRGVYMGWFSEDVYRCDHCGLYWTYFVESADQHRTGWTLSDKL